MKCRSPARVVPGVAIIQLASKNLELQRRQVGQIDLRNGRELSSARSCVTQSTAVWRNPGVFQPTSQWSNWTHGRGLDRNTQLAAVQMH